ncbi:hypothetical protein [Photorhabdus heterorhabditis]|uniref:Uncharacterized protein n=1 Tax=Photorhabdus heterorhabditis TaxID=880156 RepID=A0A5B0WVH3_9GAMM|nr:hypothetical protein [Photorhabdus heterorhabditis]KAA1190171.1 hypothetical protein F0L16_09465 [Photorhabdus heterorhabditis]
MSHCVTAKLIRPVSSQTICHLELVRNRRGHPLCIIATTAPVMIEQSHRSRKDMTRPVMATERQNPLPCSLVRIMYIMLNLVRHSFSS